MINHIDLAVQAMVAGRQEEPNSLVQKYESIKKLKSREKYYERYKSKGRIRFR